MSDHMESSTDPTCTRCGLFNRDFPGRPLISWEYGSLKTTCETCQRLYVKDIINVKQKLEELISNTKWNEVKDGDDE